MGINTPRDLTIPFVVDHPEEPVNCRYHNLYDAIKTKVSLTHGRWQSVELSGAAGRKRSLRINEPGIVGADTTALALPQIPAGSVTAGPVEIDLYGVAGDAVSSDSATGGAIVGTATLQLLFWGGFWEKAFAPSTGDIRNTVAALLNSPYLNRHALYIAPS